VSGAIDRLLASISGRTAVVSAAGCELHYVEAGRGPTVVLLHGMPSFWYSWHHQLEALVAAGYRVIVPDLPGYNRSGKLDRISDYDDGRLLEYFTAFIQHVAKEPVIVVGHDHGAWIAWMLAMHRPSLVRRLVIAGVPHPRRMREGFFRWQQFKRSWYVYLIQIPGLMELAFRAFGYRALRHAVSTNRINKPIDPEDLALHVEAARQPGALRGMLSYYRANARAMFRRDPLWWSPRLPTISVPTLVVWPTADKYVDPRMSTPYQEDVPDLRVVDLEGGHWVHEDNPARFNQELLRFVAQDGEIARVA
jgi:pimeloyl-ACP methyl ester carboxylesterase